MTLAGAYPAAHGHPAVRAQRTVTPQSARRSVIRGVLTSVVRRREVEGISGFELVQSRLRKYVSPCASGTVDEWSLLRPPTHLDDLHLLLVVRAHQVVHAPRLEREPSDLPIIPRCARLAMDALG